MNPWTIAHQAPLFTGFPREELLKRVVFPPPGDLPHPGINTLSLASPALAGGFFTTGATWEAFTERQVERHSFGEGVGGVCVFCLHL